MGVLTEMALRQELKAEELAAMKQYRVKPGTIVTPSARAYLADHKIELVFGDAAVPAQEPPSSKQPAPPDAEAPSNLPEFTKPKRYESLYGGFFEEKPEHMTALYGTKLVYKDHPVIALRGKLDRLETRILEVQYALHKNGMDKAVTDLEEVLGFVKTLMRCEVLREAVPEMHLLGMNADEIRERSHHPKKYYGINHFFPDYTHGEAVILLNSLRAQAREVELAAYGALKDAYGVPTRSDILQALNRLSSLLYIMMFKARTGEY